MTSRRFWRRLETPDLRGLPVRRVRRVQAARKERRARGLLAPQDRRDRPARREARAQWELLVTQEWELPAQVVLPVLQGRRVLQAAQPAPLAQGAGQVALQGRLAQLELRELRVLVRQAQRERVARQAHKATPAHKAGRATPAQVQAALPAHKALPAPREMLA